MNEAASIRRRGPALSLVRIRVPNALALALPLLAIIAWYSFSAYTRYARYARLSDDAIPLDAAGFQIFLHDELSRDLSRLWLDEVPASSKLDVFEISIDAKGTAALERDAQREGKRGYVNALVRRNGQVYKADIRFQGRRHWNAVGVQKSMKVRLDRGDLIDGVRVFNLLNDVTPFGLEEQIILDLAREGGLLAPEYRPVRVRLNNVDIGVYRFEAQPGEGLLRRNRRMPSAMYSGELDKVCAPGEPATACGWRKIVARADEAQDDLRPIDALLAAVFHAGPVEFRRFALDHLDLERFALFEALDVAFGGQQHDAGSNHKLYFDAYRGRFEPVARDFRAFTHDPFVNLADNPLLVRLKEVPEYLALRDARLYALITGEASPSAIRARVDAWFEALLPDLRADPHWDAYKLLPRATRFHRQMVRPMNAGRWLLSAAAELETYARRVRFLLDRLEAPSLEARAEKVAGGFVVDLVVSGHGAHRLDEVRVDRGSMMLWADRDLDDRRSAGDRAEGAGAIAVTLLSGQRVVGPALRTERVPRRYRFLVEAPDASGVIFEATNLVTGGSMRIDVPIGALAVTATAAGESPHPWSYPADPAPATVHLGPGRVVARSYGAHETVHVAAGTTLLVPEGRLVFRGPVFAIGRPDAPIEIRPEGDGFLGVALLGPSTAGARFEHVAIRGARAGEDVELVHTPSLLDLYDTRDVVLADLEIDARGGPALHATYVDGLSLHEVRILRSKGDAVDLEHSRASIRGLEVLGAEEECLDLMGTTLRVSDSILAGCAQNAISAGEETRLRLHGSLIADAEVGVLAKNASSVRVARTMVYRAKHALRTNRRDVHYDAPSSIDAEDFYVVDTDAAVRPARRTRIAVHELHTAPPAPGRLPAIDRRVGDWSALDRRLDEWRLAP